MSPLLKKWGHKSHTRTETDTRDNSVIGSETFTYDDAGNIISDSDGNTYEYGDNNRLTKYNNTPCTSTSKGSTDTYVQNGQTYSVTYDARNRLEKINGSYNQYWYDADNNRINMYYYSTNMQYTYDCSDGRSRLVWSNDHKSTVTTYAYGAEGLLWSRANGAYQIYHYDCQGIVYL